MDEQNINKITPKKNIVLGIMILLTMLIFDSIFTLIINEVINDSTKSIFELTFFSNPLTILLLVMFSLLPAGLYALGIDFIFNKKRIFIIEIDSSWVYFLFGASLAGLLIYYPSTNSVFINPNGQTSLVVITLLSIIGGNLIYFIKKLTKKIGNIQ
ncbi:MAG: hypothetical protein ACNFW9_05060 [Candidatus Kerfeldbacteria bacterium]